MYCKSVAAQQLYARDVRKGAEIQTKHLKDVEVQKVALVYAA